MLAERGEEDGLAQTARELAWSPNAPPPAATKGLAARVRAALEEELRQLEEERLLEEERRRAAEEAHAHVPSSRQPAVGTHDVRSFRAARRARSALRVLLAGGAVLLLAAAVASARDLDPRDRGLLPTGTTGVVVLDLSLSIVDDQSGVVRRTLQDAHRRGRAGRRSSSSRTFPTS